MSDLVSRIGVAGSITKVGYCRHQRSPQVTSKDVMRQIRMEDRANTESQKD